jgi:hypothetical protein
LMMRWRAPSPSRVAEKTRLVPPDHGGPDDSAGRAAHDVRSGRVDRRRREGQPRRLRPATGSVADLIKQAATAAAADEAK